MNERWTGLLPRDRYWENEVGERMSRFVAEDREDAAEHGTVYVPDDIQ